MRDRLYLLGAAFLLLAAAATPRVYAAEPKVNPTYTVEPCCDLCSRASQRAAYNTKFLASFTTLVQGQDGWLFRSDDELRTAFGPDAEGYAGLRRFHEQLKRRGVQLAIVMQPPRAMMHADKLDKSTRSRYDANQARKNYADLLARLRQLGILVPDLLPLAERAYDGEDEFFFRADHHWTPYGARQTAKLVAAAIKAAPVHAALPPRNFVTERVGVLAKKGTLHKAAAQICGGGYADQYVDRFVTEPAGSSDLFGEEELPQVVLAGTSNSDGAYNFAGFLAEYMGVDVLNQSVTGGGPEGALVAYLPTPEFQTNRPKLLIWEIETYHNLSNRNFYRQVIPRVYNGCAGRSARLTGNTELRGTSAEVLFNGGGKLLPLASKDHVLDLQFSDPAVRELKAIVWYTNGSRETLNIKYPDRVDAGGRFISELRSDSEWGDRVFMSLDLILPEGVPPGVGVKAALCERADAAAPVMATKTAKGKKRRGH